MISISYTIWNGILVITMLCEAVFSTVDGRLNDTCLS